MIDLATTPANFHHNNAARRLARAVIMEPIQATQAADAGPPAAPVPRAFRSTAGDFETFGYTAGKLR